MFALPYRYLIGMSIDDALQKFNTTALTWSLYPSLILYFAGRGSSRHDFRFWVTGRSCALMGDPIEMKENINMCQMKSVV